MGREVKNRVGRVTGNRQFFLLSLRKNYPPIPKRRSFGYELNNNKGKSS